MKLRNNTAIFIEEQNIAAFIENCDVEIFIPLQIINPNISGN